MNRIVLMLALTGAGLAVPAEQGEIDVLRIGTSGTLSEEISGPKEKSAMETLKRFIKDETGLDNEILRQKDWRELTDKLAKGQMQLGVYQGYEFAWAQEKNPDLKPLALAVNVELYPIVYVVTQKTSKAKDFAGLQGQTLALPATGQRYLQLFTEHECQAGGKTPEKFFSKITHPDNIEDAIDDVVDGVVSAAVADKSSLEGFKRRKPARFAKLKEVAKSQRLPPVTIAYYGKLVDDATLSRLKDGLRGASKKEQGETVLTLFRLTGFQLPPDDFGKILAETRKTFPPPPAKAP
jgi:ABC-type phosphate/phosphonate transport system substrate-binding protein